MSHNGQNVDSVGERKKREGEICLLRSYRMLEVENLGYEKNRRGGVPTLFPPPAISYGHPEFSYLNAHTLLGDMGVQPGNDIL